MCTTSIAMAMKLKKVASKLLTEEAKHVGGDHMVTQAVWSKGLKACWHVSTKAYKAREARKHSRHVATTAREYVNHLWHVSK